MARGGWDDIYPVGPPEVLFPALERFWEQLGEHCGLERQLTKCFVYSGNGVRPAAMPDMLPLAGEIFDDQFEPGFVCYGVPIGTNNYMANMLDRKVNEVA